MLRGDVWSDRRDHRELSSLSRRCSATVLLPAASTSHPTRSATSPSASPIGTFTSTSAPSRAPCEGELRERLERRPISLIVLSEPLDGLDGLRSRTSSSSPPVHQRVYRMGLEHLGVVVGEEIDEFSRVHRAALTGQQFQRSRRRAVLRPVRGLHPREVLPALLVRRRHPREGGRFDGFSHVDDWVPQPLVTATGPNRSRGDVRLLPGYKTARWARAYSRLTSLRRPETRQPGPTHIHATVRHLVQRLQAVSAATGRA